MIILNYQTHAMGKMPKPAGNGYANRWFSAQPARYSPTPEEKITLSLFYGGI
ncbi:MAG: hypothetical protein JW757_10965 [Anaerolineales bacterium]|nr:hypothetical protein [Anaerolineales bacterium]